jgi:stage V sporulation protein G
MEITDVRVRKLGKEGKMRAIVSVTFDNELVIHDIKVIEGDNGPFIAMPSRKTLDGEFRDVAHPINATAREKIQTFVIKKYNELLSDAPEPEKEIDKDKEKDKEIALAEA